MDRKKLYETIRKIIKEELQENQPAVSPTKPETEPAVHPGKPGTDKPKPRRPLGNPNVQPKPKATMNEADVLKKIITRFKSKHPSSLKEEKNSDWEKGYKTGYSEGFKDGKENKKNKFQK
jgi:flagellar biosynthesis/type III secretory pathway protein FliH